MSRTAQVPMRPTMEQYAKMISAHEADPLEEKASVPMSVVAKKPIPKHLLMRGKSTRPVPKVRPSKRPGGWRSITAGDAVNYGVKAWQLAKHLATLINVEEKVFDVDGSAGSVVTTTPTVVNLTNIAQGSDYFNRIGDSILAQEIEFHAVAASHPSVNGNFLRVLIVRDKLQRGVDPVLGDVLQGGTSPLVQPYLEPQDQRFDILYDHLIAVNAQGSGLATSGTSTTFLQQRAILPVLKRKWNQHIKYQGTTAADASNWLGGLYLLLVADQASSGPTFQYTFRIRFTDN